MPAGYRSLKNEPHGLLKPAVHRDCRRADCRRCQYENFAGSEVSILRWKKPIQRGLRLSNRRRWLTGRHWREFMRGLGFVPLIATTALATGVYAVAGFTFVYSVGYLAPNPWIAAILGAIVISAEVLLLRSIGKWLGRYPSVRNASDNIRNAMNMLMEMALLIGSILPPLRWLATPVSRLRWRFTSLTNR